MKRVLLVLGLACAGLLAVLIPALAQQRGRMPRSRSGVFIQYVANDLNLTPTQRTQIRAILDKERPALLTIMRQAQQQEELFRSRRSFDEVYVRSIAQKQSANLVEAIVEKEKIRAQVHAVLTPEQRAKFNRWSTEFRAAIEDRLDNLAGQ